MSIACATMSRSSLWRLLHLLFAASASAQLGPYTGGRPRFSFGNSARDVDYVYRPLGGRGAKKLVANACREAVSEGGARDGFNGNSAIRILLPDDSVRRLPGTTTEGSLRDLELRAAILGYGPDAGDDSGRVVVQPRAIAMRTRSL